MAGWIRRAHSGRYQARYRTPGGRTRSKTFDRRKDAEKWLRRELALIDRGDWIDPRHRTLVLTAGYTGARFGNSRPSNPETSIYPGAASLSPAHSPRSAAPSPKPNPRRQHRTALSPSPGPSSTPSPPTSTNTPPAALTGCSPHPREDRCDGQFSATFLAPGRGRIRRPTHAISRPETYARRAPHRCEHPPEAAAITARTLLNQDHARHLRPPLRTPRRDRRRPPRTTDRRSDRAQNARGTRIGALTIRPRKDEQPLRGKGC
jgi:hypothetical protein